MIKIIQQTVIAIIVFTLTTISSADDKSISISTGEWPPFLSENLKHNGVAARIISEAFALQNVKVQYGWFPWKRSYDNVKVGSWDASAIWAITAERTEEFLFSDPIIESNTVLFFRKSSLIDWQSYKDLSHLVIGATDGYFNGDEFAAAEKSGLITVERANTESSNFRKLAANRLDAVIAEVNVGHDIMRKILTTSEIQSIVTSPKTMAPFSNHLIISKKLNRADELISTFNKGLKQLTESGKVAQYLEESRNGQYHQ